MASDFLYSYCSIAVLSDHMQASKRNLCYNNASRQRKNHTTDFFINNCAVNPPDSSVWDIRRHMTFSESHDAQTKNGVPKYKFEELHIII